MSSISPEFLKQKAREISYALNRVSFYIKREDLRNRLERLSVDFLESVAFAGEDASDKQSLLIVFKNISALDVLIRLGYSLYEIETVNANILLKEIESFNSAIRQFCNSAIANPFAGESANIESIFSMPPAIIRQTENQATCLRRQVPQTDLQEGGAEIADNIAMIDKEKEIVAKAYSAGEESLQTAVADSFINKPSIKNIISENRVAASSGNSAIRQNLIADKIRQIGKVTVKEVTVQFPGVSERTLRYDLQKLCDQGVLERVGNSGPGTSYIPKKVD